MALNHSLRARFKSNKLSALWAYKDFFYSMVIGVCCAIFLKSKQIISILYNEFCMGALIENNESRYMADLTNFIWRFNSDTVFCSLKRGICSREVRYIEGLLYLGSNPRNRSHAPPRSRRLPRPAALLAQATVCYWALLLPPACYPSSLAYWASTTLGSFLLPLA
jgi:hypothetical protein